MANYAGRIRWADVYDWCTIEEVVEPYGPVDSSVGNWNDVNGCCSAANYVDRRPTRNYGIDCPSRCTVRNGNYAELD